MTTFILKRLLYSLKKNLRNFGYEKLSMMPDGSIEHHRRSMGSEFSDYRKYNIIWANPDTGKGLGIEYKLDDYTSNILFMKDKAVIDQDPILKARLDIIINHMRKGEFVTTDDDVTIGRKYNFSGDKVYYKWDTCTHFLQDYLARNRNRVLPYSKDLDNKNRLTYDIFRPVKENGKWVCHIRLNRCLGHSYDEDEYIK